VYKRQQFLRTQRLESLVTLAGGIAHDLNNILAPILGFSRLLPLKLPDVDEQTKGFFKIMENNANRGSALVKQILTFSRGLDGERGIVQIRHLITEVGQIINETFPKSIELVTNVPKNLWTVNADVNQLHQILMNLAVNARDAMPNGGTLTIDAENMTVDAEYARLHLDAIEGSYVLITVTDTGMGIPAEVIDRIFEPFFTTKETGRGTGLGLSTVIGIVKSHGGFVDVTSDRQGNSRGTQFKVFLPASDTVASNLEEPAEILQGNGELILVVDDEPAILEVTQATLETYNYRVLSASNGIDAIATYAQNQGEISLAIVDIMMPAMDGKTAIRVLKQLNPELKIMAVSGLIDRQEIIAELADNVTAFINKPYGNDDLLRTISEILS
jgi:two-component system cell cycle sensor histidine kinase/response regulator CckA